MYTRNMILFNGCLLVSLGIGMIVVWLSCARLKTIERNLSSRRRNKLCVIWVRGLFLLVLVFIRYMNIYKTVFNLCVCVCFQLRCFLFCIIFFTLRSKKGFFLLLHQFSINTYKLWISFYTHCKGGCWFVTNQ